MRKTFEVIDGQEEKENILGAENISQSDFDQSCKEPNFDIEYVAKVLGYKDEIQKSSFVGMIDYRDPCALR